MSTILEPDHEISSHVAIPASHPHARATSGRAGRAVLWLLLGLTILGGIARFSTLSRPALWGDEAATFSRVTGDYRDLLGILQADGFVPLHYELYWLQGKWLGFSPAVMRLIPALAGTLMIPAIFFLASQIVNRRAALLTAAFACTSAYLMVYSHDAKMYMHFWLMCVVHVACLLWWLRTRLRFAWLAWVAAGLAMVGLHSSGLAILGIEVLIALTIGWNVTTKSRHAAMDRSENSSADHSATQDHRSTQRVLTKRSLSLTGWRAPVLFVAGLLIILSGPIGYYSGFNRWNQRISEYGWGRASGLGWIPGFNAGLTGPELFRYAGSAYLVGWEWTSPREENNVTPWVVASLKGAVVLLAAACVAGMFPWKSRKDMLVPGHTPAGAGPPQPAWRALLWLAGWIILPMYGFYLVSVKNGDGPTEWANAVGALFQQQWWMLLGEMLAVAVLCVGWRGAARWLAWAGPAFVLISFNAFWLQAGLDRPAGAVEAWVDWITSASVWPGVMLGALVIWPGVAWYYSGQSMRRRNARLLMLLGVAGIIVGLCYILHEAVHAWARDALADYGPIWQARYMGIVWPAMAMAVAVLLLRLPTRTLRWGAITLLLATNVVQAWARLDIHGSGTEPRVDLVAADVAQAAESKGAIRTFVSRRTRSIGGGPGTGSLGDYVGRYYMAIALNRNFPPLELRKTGTEELYSEVAMANPGQFHQLMRNPPDKLHELILWGYDYRSQGFHIREQELQPPQAAWRLQSEETYRSYNYWSWEQFPTMRRRVYERKEPTPSP